MKKTHTEEEKGPQAQIGSSGLPVEVDAPKSQVSGKIMADILAQYGKLAQKNREELYKYWSQQTEENNEQSAEIRAAEMMLVELRRTIQALEINLKSVRNLKAKLKNSLREVETHYARQMEQLNRVLLQLESELAQTWAEGQCQVREYEALLNIKIKLEAEVATYRHLLEDREDFNPGDTLDSSNSMQASQKTTTCRIVDSIEVSETNDTEVLRH
ncbi:Keratin, type I cytoskeletal 18 [Saguinus oedipus]|uniref:Keratin, type I cytoskeletal 18 n=1 Tax=Saguinus oedipus TaxID=9490 RepID=A0ABQ9W8V5_SAGOE|nr:Keratin, type I cytoskeletal 18 [Saguinus oedipus]